MVGIGKITILGALLVWLYTGAEQAKQVFAILFAIATIRFAVKWIQHRRTWSKYVTRLLSPVPVLSVSGELMLCSPVHRIRFSGAI